MGERKQSHSTKKLLFWDRTAAIFVISPTQLESALLVLCAAPGNGDRNSLSPQRAQSFSRPFLTRGAFCVSRNIAGMFTCADPHYMENDLFHVLEIQPGIKFIQPSSHPLTVLGSRGENRVLRSVLFCMCTQVCLSVC